MDIMADAWADDLLRLGMGMDLPDLGELENPPAVFWDRPGVIRTATCGGRGGGVFDDVNDSGALDPASARPMHLSVHTARYQEPVDVLVSTLVVSYAGNPEGAAVLAQSRNQGADAHNKAVGGSREQMISCQLEGAADREMLLVCRQHGIDQPRHGRLSSTLRLVGAQPNRPGPPQLLVGVRGEWNEGTHGHSGGLVSALAFELWEAGTSDFRPAAPVVQTTPAQSNSRGTFRFTAPPGFTITCFHGRNGWFLDALGVYMAAAVPRTWTAQLHRSYPSDFKAAVRTLLLFAHRTLTPPSGGRGLPTDVVELVAKELVRSCYFEFTSLEEAGFMRWELSRVV